MGFAIRRVRRGEYRREFLQLGSTRSSRRCCADSTGAMRGLENVRQPRRAVAQRLLVPTRGRRDVRRGRVKRTLLWYRPGAEHVGHTNGGMVWTALFCEPAVLDDTIRLLHGVEPAQSPGTSTFEEPDPAALDALRAALQQAFFIAEAAPHVLESHATRRSLEESILTVAIDAIDPRGDPAAPGGPMLSHERVVRRAEDSLADKLDTPIYVADLCDAAGVSERTLRNAFQSLYGISPIRFIQLRRLHQVRRALRAPQASVTEARRYGSATSAFALISPLFGSLARNFAVAPSRVERQRRDCRCERHRAEPPKARASSQRAGVTRRERRAQHAVARSSPASITAEIPVLVTRSCDHVSMLRKAETGCSADHPWQPRVVGERDEHFGAPAHFLSRDLRRYRVVTDERRDA
jgi:AraC-like DNA-binding protein